MVPLKSMLLNTVWALVFFRMPTVASVSEFVSLPEWSSPAPCYEPEYNQSLDWCCNVVETPPSCHTKSALHQSENRNPITSWRSTEGWLQSKKKKLNKQKWHDTPYQFGTSKIRSSIKLKIHYLDCMFLTSAVRSDDNIPCMLHISAIRALEPMTNSEIPAVRCQDSSCFTWHQPFNNHTAYVSTLEAPT